MKYFFKVPFSYAKGGEKIKAEYIEVAAPSNKVHKHVSRIDREFNAALFELSNRGPKAAEGSAESNEVSARELLMILIAAGSNMEVCFDALEKILINQGQVDGSEPFTEILFGKMDYNDTKELLGEYIKSFLYISQVS